VESWSGIGTRFPQFSLVQTATMPSSCRNAYASGAVHHRRRGRDGHHTGHRAPRFSPSRNLYRAVSECYGRLPGQRNSANQSLNQTLSQKRRDLYRNRRTDIYPCHGNYDMILKKLVLYHLSVQSGMRFLKGGSAILPHFSKSCPHQS